MTQSRYFVLNSLDDFRTMQRSICVWNPQDQLFHLALNHQPRFPVLDQEDAFNQWAQSQPLVMDKFQQLGFLSDDKTQLFYAVNWQHKLAFEKEKTLSDLDLAKLNPRATAGPVLVTSESLVADTAAEITLSPVIASEGKVFVDMHLGGDGRVALIESDFSGKHCLRLVHLSRCWQLHLDWQDEAEENTQPWRCWVDQHNRIWVAGDTSLAVFEGEPLPQNYQPWADRFEPLFINPNPLRLLWKTNLPPERKLMALCANPTQLHLLMLMNDRATQEIVSFKLDVQAQTGFTIRRLKKLPLITDIASTDEDQVFCQFYAQSSEVKHCDFASLLLDEEGYTLEKRRYPMHSQQSVRFVRGDNLVTQYLASDGPKKILPLPQARYVEGGGATLNRLLDSGNPDTWWDRIYIDASIPSGCALTISVNAFDDAENPPVDWQVQHQAAKLPIPSELAFYKSRFDYKNDYQGLYEILLQRVSGETRDIRGRYLQLKIDMKGDGRHTPAIESLRVAYPRISWQENYLPPVFHQQQDVDITNEDEANGADFRERVLSAFDGIFSPLEKRIASAEAWVIPKAAPQQHLPTLSSFLGETLPEFWPETRQRIWLSCLSELQRLKGTYAGLCLALDIATDGAIAKGQIVPVENYLMRRTLSTIIGIDMDDAEHPLTLGTRQSGNSIVGETLFLGDETSREFVSLLAPELSSLSDKEIAAEFLDKYAHRISIVVHKLAFIHINSIKKIIIDYVPASLHTKIIQTDHPFIPGLSPLLGIDTYLETAVKARQIILDDTRLGQEGIMRNQASFSPRDVMLGNRDALNH